jgi:hypothetical protein
MIMLTRGAGDPARVELAIRVLRPSSADEVLEAIRAYATALDAPVYVERAGDRYRWSPVHRGGPSALGHVLARFLGCEFSDVTIGFVTLDGWCVIRDPKEPPADRHLILEAITIDATTDLEALLADG